MEKSYISYSIRYIYNDGGIAHKKKETKMENNVAEKIVESQTEERYIRRERIAEGRCRKPFFL